MNTSHVFSTLLTRVEYPEGVSSINPQTKTKYESEFENMSYISRKKRSKNYLAPAIFLTGLTTAALANQTASADTITGWDTTGSGGNMSDANGALSSATSDITSNAESKASSNTSAAPSATGSNAIGWVDVYVDHTNLDDAIKYAMTNGVNLVHDKSVVLEGDSVETVKNTTTAKEYYKSKAQSITDITTKYINDLGNYNATVAKNNADAKQANAEMDALRANLAAQGQINILESKQYSAAGVAADKLAVQKGLADGRAYLDAKLAKDNANTVQNAMVLFTTAAAQGHVKLENETVTIASQADADKYIADLNKQHAELQEYLNNLSGQTGSIPEDEKPTFKNYTFVIDADVEALGTKPVTTYTYTAIPVTKPITPSVNYHFYDVRSKPTSNSGWDNADGETLILGPNDNAGGNVVAQAMKNQTIGINTDNQPLPAHRWDKIQDLTIVTKLPDGVEFDLAKSNTDPTNWTITYDESTNTVTQTATPAYLVQVNLNQDPNNSGTIGGTTGGEWEYKAPQVFFKLLEDDKTYQANSTTIVNKEYMFVGAGIQIRTDSADPSKANTNSKYQNIDGKAVLPGSINNYVLGWDFAQYKGVNIDAAMQEKGLHLVDDYPEDAVELTGPISIIDPVTGKVLYSADITPGADLGSTGTFKDANGKEVEGFTWSVIDNDSAPENLKGKLDGKAIMISYTGHDNEFYKKYVEGGYSLNVIMPMTTKKIDNTPGEPGGSYNGNKYTNVAWQSDFGNEYKSNEVENTAPLLDPNKDAVLSYANAESVDINKNPTSAIENGTFFMYKLSGSKLPNNLSEDLKSYVFTDELPVDSDEYSGEFVVENGEVIVFKKGSTLAQRYPNGIPASSDISKYFTQTIKRNQVGSDGTTITLVSLSADADFLAQIDYDKTNFQVDAYLSTKRIKNNQAVKNVFNEVINGIDFGSNEVITNSKPNAIDELNEKLNSLESSASSGIASNGTAIGSMNGALSVIIGSIDGLSSDTSSAVSSLASDNNSMASSLASESMSSSMASGFQSLFDWTNTQVSLVQSSTDSAVNSVASSASSAIATNSGAIKDIASQTSSQTSSLASSANSAIASLAANLAEKTHQNVATITIFDKAVKTDADALQFAVNHGIAPGSIKNIEKRNGLYVVSYNVSKTGINNSKPATIGGAAQAIKPQTYPSGGVKPAIVGTTKPVPGMVQPVYGSRTRQLSFYTLKTEADVRVKLASLGYPASSIVSVKPLGAGYQAVVKVK